MKLNIVYNSCGRLRLRCGNGYFLKSQEHTLEKVIAAQPYVYSAKASSVNGGVLITYNTSKQDELMSFLRSVNISLIEKTQRESDKINSEFKHELVKAVAKRFIMRTFLPAPISTVVTHIRALPYLKGALSSIFGVRADVALLDGVAVSAALLRGMYKEVNSVMFLLNISGLLEDYTRKRTKNALAESLTIKTDTVWKIENGKQVKTPLSLIKKDDIVVFRDGTMIAVDGTVTEGHAMVNESSMTGEPLAVLKKEGTVVYAGTVVEEGSISVRAHSKAGDNRISHIVDMIENGENLKAGVQSRAEKLANSIVPYSLGLSLITYVFTRNITKALSVLMVDYSCAIKLATPICVISAMREASGHGFVVKGGKHFESFSNADTIVFDKTGTLTNACPIVEKVIPFGDYTEELVLKTAACLEEHFPHSMAKSVVNAAHERGLNHEEEHADVEYVVAHGIVTSLHGKRAIIGSEHFVVEDEGVAISNGDRDIIEKESNGFSTIYLAVAGKLAGVICISDPPRSEAAQAIKMLRKQGVKNIVMLTGDHISAAKRIADMIGVDRFEAQVLPEFKADYIKQLKDEGKKVIMVGDGINDSPALAAADVSVAMKDSSDLAREVADVTLTSGDLRDLTTVRELSKRMLERINANYSFIVLFNTALILLGMAGVITPSLSSFMHNASTMLISAHSMKPLLNK